MDITLEKKNEKSKSRMLIISLAIIVLVVFSLSLQIMFSLLQNEKIYKGVYVDGINAGGLLPQELGDRLETRYKNEYNNVKVTISSEEYEKKYYLKDFDFSYDIDNTIDKAYSVGREGNIFKRLFEVINISFNEREISCEIGYNINKVNDIVDSFYNNIYIPAEDPGFKIDNDFVLITSGHHGKSINKEQLKNEIVSFINERKTSHINISMNITQKASINIDSLFSKINSEPVNASTKIENGQLIIVPHKNGINIDKELLKDAVINLNDTEDKVEKVKLSQTIPEITESKIKANLFKDTLASFKTYYSTDGQINIDRTENLRLAAEKINGKILTPGDIFSFNGTVGERTIANGYKNAHVFEGGKIIEGLGGGICQVSSTLYNAALKANLSIVERVNHMFTVSYAQYGLDATVSYGVIDFKFKNSTKWPLKIESYMTNNNELIFTLRGTNDNVGLSVELLPQVIKTNPFKTVYIDDPNLNGYVVDTYKIVKQDGKEISRTKITSSVYTSLEKRVSRGTKKVPIVQSQQPAENEDNTPLTENPVSTDNETSTGSNSSNHGDNGTDTSTNGTAGDIDIIDSTTDTIDTTDSTTGTTDTTTDTTDNDAGGDSNTSNNLDTNPNTINNSNDINIDGNGTEGNDNLSN